MPIFEYRCQSCDRNFELFIRSSAASLACPECGSMEIKKKFSTFGFSTGRSGFESSAVSSSSSCGHCSSHQCSGCHH
ncbi:MAG TPA: FmdB family transcriptional regulator [candidate division Zixibacteria bacterium]|nr:FmdB family transcriptional regulator [candidate division Zixibacteria bacterium]HBZ00858.1 FmdB family transcriptional regulator [candidate division Zixibacteria bacterium]